MLAEYLTVLSELELRRNFLFILAGNVQLFSFLVLDFCDVILRHRETILHKRQEINLAYNCQTLPNQPYFKAPGGHCAHVQQYTK